MATAGARAFPPPADAADRIVAATLACIDKDGIDGITIRTIARTAGVNVAAINYYFRTKDHLVALVLERALDRGVEDPLAEFDRLVASGKDARTALTVVLDDVVAHAVRCPRTAFAHFHGPLVLQDYRRDVVVRTNALLERLFQRLRRRLVGRGDEAKRAALAHVWSAVLMTSLAPSLLRPFVRMDLRSAKKRRAWVTALVHRALIEAPKARRAGGRRGGGRR